MLIGLPKEIKDNENRVAMTAGVGNSIEDMIAMIASYCQGMMIWSHPNSQVNVIPH
jgi:hypothetical protein